MRARALLALLALPLLGAVPAQAGSVTLPGCYGVGDTIYCNVTVEYANPPTVEFYSENVPVCASTCYDVPVTLVRAYGGGSAAMNTCVSWTDSGGSHRECPLRPPR